MNYNLTRQQDTKLEHAHVIFVLPFSIKSFKYALIDDLKDV